MFSINLRLILSSVGGKTYSFIIIEVFFINVVILIEFTNLFKKISFIIFVIGLILV